MKLVLYLFVSDTPQIVEVLLKAGGHVDQVTASGERPSKNLRLNPKCHISILNYTSLKCLAARVIQKHRIPYAGEVPKHLEAFVKMH